MLQQGLVVISASGTQGHSQDLWKGVSIVVAKGSRGNNPWENLASNDAIWWNLLQNIGLIVCCEFFVESKRGGQFV